MAWRLRRPPVYRGFPTIPLLEHVVSQQREEISSLEHTVEERRLQPASVQQWPKEQYCLDQINAARDAA